MRNNTTGKNSRENLQKKVSNARFSLLILSILTLVNLVMLLLDTGTYFLFSAAGPYFLTSYAVGLDMCAGIAGIGPSTSVALIISAAILVMYLLCWLQSKNRTGWLVVAVVALVVDTLALLGLCLAFQMIMPRLLDLVIHVVMILELIQAINACNRLKTMRTEPAVHTWDSEDDLFGPDF